MSVRPQTPVHTSLPLPLSPLPPLPASLFIPPVDHREDTSEAELPPYKRLCLTALTSRYKVAESSMAAPRPTEGHGADYGFIGTIDDEGGRAHCRSRAGYSGYYAVIEDTHDMQNADISEEALVSQEAWAHSIGLSTTVHYKPKAYRTHTQMQDYRIASQESLTTTLIAHVSSLQGQLSAALGHIQALQARESTHAGDTQGAASTANNMPPKRTSTVVRAIAAPMTAAAIEQLIKARVSAALANHETL
ncbi:hypothetical protein Tco_0269444 [Tanacetum coccineum]